MRQAAALMFCIVLEIALFVDSDPFEPWEGRAHDEANVSLVSFDVPAGDLGEALLRFGEQANLCLAFDPGLARGKITQGISGAYSTPHALEMLVKNSGLHIISLTGSRYRLEP